MSDKRYVYVAVSETPFNIDQENCIYHVVEIDGMRYAPEAIKEAAYSLIDYIIDSEQ